MLNPGMCIAPRPALRLAPFVADFNVLVEKVKAVLVDEKLSIQAGLIQALENTLERLTQVMNTPDAMTSDVLPSLWCRAMILIDCLSECSILRASVPKDTASITSVPGEALKADLTTHPDGRAYSLVVPDHIDAAALIKARPTSLFKNYPAKRDFCPGTSLFLPKLSKPVTLYGNFHPSIKLNLISTMSGIVRTILLGTVLRKRIPASDGAVFLKLKDSSEDPVRFLQRKLVGKLERGSLASLTDDTKSIFEQFGWKRNAGTKFDFDNDHSFDQLFRSQSTMDGEGLATLCYAFVEQPAVEKRRKNSVAVSTASSNKKKPKTPVVRADNVNNREQSPSPAPGAHRGYSRSPSPAPRGSSDGNRNQDRYDDRYHQNENRGHQSQSRGRGRGNRHNWAPNRNNRSQRPNDNWSYGRDRRGPPTQYDGYH